MSRKVTNIPEKFLLTFDEAASYFGIGENKLRNMASYGEIGRAHV